MTSDSKALYEFRKQLEALKKFQGRGTELISVYITPGYNISEIVNKLKEEYGQASNIKSATTKKNVQAALEKIMHFLKGANKPPENGMAVFCGNVSESEGKVDIEIYSIVPPMPVPVQFYRCESKFVLEPLEELLDVAGTYGLVVMDGKECTVAVLRGKTIKVLKKLESTAHQKVHKGGQSAQRFQRLAEEGIEFYYKRIGEAMDAFLSQKNFKGAIVGGPGPAKENFMKMKPFNYQIKVLGVVDTGYTDEYGLRELLEKASDLIAEQEAIVEKKLLNEFLIEAAKGGLVAWGLEGVRKALDKRQANKFIVTEGLEIIEDGVNVVSHLISQAEEQGIEVIFVSEETPEGQQFKGTFGGLGAFLRYR
ncbi:MAG: peptide chain release factor aRF-1 [Candidatus Norongarragalinales archaeon]